MKKDFESRFMPNVKFLIPKDALKDGLLLDMLYESIPCECRSPFPFGAVTSSDSSIISVICNSTDSYKYFNYNDIKEVSIYEAIPELIPDGMRYNKELDKLVPNVVEYKSNQEIETLFKEAMKQNKDNLSIISGISKELSSKYPFDHMTVFYIVRDNFLFKGKDNLKENSIEELDKLATDSIQDKKSVTDEYTAGIDLKKEIINERENGFIKADLEKLDFSLVDPFAYSDLAFQLTFGAKKYSKDNWKKGDINIYLSALERHIQDIKKALDEYDIEKLIDDTGIQHGGALLCNSMFIHYFIRQILKDKNVK